MTWRRCPAAARAQLVGHPLGAVRAELRHDAGDDGQITHGRAERSLRSAPAGRRLGQLPFDIEARLTAAHSASRSSQPASEASAKPSLARHLSMVVGMFVGVPWGVHEGGNGGWGLCSERNRRVLNGSVVHETLTFGNKQHPRDPIKAYTIYAIHSARNATPGRAPA